MQKEVYLISNIHRSGSSMMMRCLEAGGLPVAYDDVQESLNYEYNTPDYVPNPNGFYALQENFDEINVAQKYTGKALKYPFRLLLNLPEDENKYNILFLKRNPDEIRASMNAFMPDQAWGADATILELYDTYFDTLLDEISKKKNISLIVINYRDIVENPQKEFQKLLNVGWPIDIEKASSMVEPSLYRLKLEKK
ncbi:MAG: hypothetical protein KBD52_01825 [Candidatus Pacebacteria bacterium]|nr:hypothetical protein [Candidatus Paceibacterota bacterium]